MRKKQTISKRTIEFGSFTVFLLTALLFLLLTFTTKNFLSGSNIYSILFDVSIQFFLCIGFTFLIIMGELDMSVGAMYGFSGALVGYLTVVRKLSFVPAMLLVLAVCMVMGFLVGVIVVRLQLNSMMVTIGMMTILQGLKSIMIDKISTRTFDAAYRNFIKTRIMGIHWSILAALALILVLEILLHKSYALKQCYFVGQRLETAKLYGIKAEKIKITAFLISAGTAAFGGIMSGSRLAHAATTAGDGMEFTAVTAAILGGASLFGGKGSILKTFMGLIFLALLSNGLISFGIDPYIQQIINGAILIAAVLLDIFLNKKRG